MRLFVVADALGLPVTAGIVGPWVSFPFSFPRPQDRHIVMARDMTSAPAGAYDVGDPYDAVWMASEPPPPTRRAIADALGVGRRDVDGMTVHQVLSEWLAHDSGASWTQPRWHGRPLTSGLLGGMFEQIKAVK